MQRAPRQRAPRWLKIARVVGAGLVPVILLGLVALGLRDSSPDEKPKPQGTIAERAVPVTPESNPTYGEYVPPRETPSAKPPPPPPPPARTTRKAPVRKTPKRPPERARQPCPPGWGDIPFLRRWCHGHGYWTR
ncbi:MULTISPECIES: hypothetical protein [Actinomadura]|uniref:Uncharacterized protein n=1 Tax=Actinomadura yumaensis TaxID=111807 RepID=A0ABW2CSX5_9ACTN|nr:hypothetical protein [Actinomadura sp. J1-007]MWK34124.1 hypothetical protein [Actinomadura sp. J1-007]